MSRLTSLLFVLAAGGSAPASGTEAILDAVQLSEAGGCVRVEVRMLRPVTVFGHWVAEERRLLQVHVADPESPQSAPPPQRQSLPLPPEAEGLLDSVEWEVTAETALLLLRFPDQHAYLVGPAADFRGIAVLVQPVTNDPAPCAVSEEPEQEGTEP